MLAAIERGRPPAVDFLNGEVQTRGARLGISTPINAAIREQVLAIAAGKARPSLDLLREFFKRTRASVAHPASLEGDGPRSEPAPAVADSVAAPVPPAPPSPPTTDADAPRSGTQEP